MDVTDKDSTTTRYLTTSQAARRLGCSRSTVLRAVRRGLLPVAARTPGGQARFAPDAVAAYAHRLATTTPAEVASLPLDVLQATYMTMACGVVVRGADGTVLHTNPAAQEILGLDLAAMRGRPLSVALGASTRPDGTPLPSDERPVVRAMRTRRPQRGTILGITRPDGAHRWLQLDAIPVLAPDGAVRHVVVSFLDVSARKQAEDRVRHQALHDALTGLPNRTLLHDRLEQALHASRRNGQPVALALLDLDRFKEVNDTLGHGAGDRLLQVVAARLEGTLRALDTVARLGGDEFAVVLPGTAGTGAGRAAQALCDALAAPVRLDGHCLAIGASVGLALFPDHGADGRALLRCADVAMYAAKRAGGGCAIYAPGDDGHSPARLALASDLRRAIEGDELCLHYQPKVDVGTGTAGWVEALVRWHHPVQGLLPPDRFIPLAEQVGLMSALTRWVLHAALRDCRMWDRAGRTLGVAVNVSAHNLRDNNLPQTVAAALAAHDIAPQRLRLELTESAIMADAAQAAEILAQVAALGVRIAVDDFGTGYTSLSYLKRLPIDEIKIDKSFVMNMAQDEADATIVASTIGLGHSLGLAFVAEGVEDEETWQTLAALGCDAAQGYHLSRPLSAGDLLHWLGTVDPAVGRIA